MDKNFGSMPLGKKVEYLWMYYKIWLVILAVVIGVIYLGCTMYKGRHTTVLLNVAVTGGDSQKAEELNKDFCKYAGIDEKDGIIRIQANIPEDAAKSLQTRIYRKRYAKTVILFLQTMAVSKTAEQQMSRFMVVPLWRK